MMLTRTNVDSPVSRIHGQDGVVAVIIAIMVVVLVGIVAFTVDFGMGYNNRSDLQTSADAAALAAAARLQELGATTCADAEANRSAALTVGLQVMQDNVDNLTLSTTDPLEVCPETDDEVPITVKWTNTATQNTSFGGVWGKSTLEIAATATAVVNQAVGGPVDAVRPWVLCSAGVQNVAGTDIKHLKFPDKGTTACPAPMTGNWWIAVCPGPGTGDSLDELGAATIDGCKRPVEVVADQSPDPGERSTELLAPTVCPPDGTTPATCLAASSVDILDGSNNLHDAVGEGLMFLTCNDVNRDYGDCSTNGPVVPFPMFCGTDACDPAATYPAGGVPTHYPVHRIVMATVCGWHFGDSAARSMAGVCAGMPDPSSDDNSMWFAFEADEVDVSLIN